MEAGGASLQVGVCETVPLKNMSVKHTYETSHATKQCLRGHTAGTHETCFPMSRTMRRIKERSHKGPLAINVHPPVRDIEAGRDVARVKLCDHGTDSYVANGESP